jgi:Tfp pilus assembly protein PilX
MTFRTFRRYSRQQGMALLVTMVILVVVTTMGLIAMRSGMLHLAIGTNAQVSMLNFQEADSGIVSVEKAVGTGSTAQNAILPNGVLGMAPGFERIACMKQGALSAPTTPTGMVRCNVSTMNTDASSGRGSMAVQVSMINPTNAVGEGQSGEVYGSDIDATPTAGTLLIRTYSTSVIPNFGGATTTTVQSCLNKTQEATSGGTITSCLSDSGAAFTTLVQEFAYGNSGYVN